MRVLNIITRLLVIIGGLNWLLVGLAEFDLVAAIFDGQTSPLSRIVYVLVGLAAIWELFRLTTGNTTDPVVGPRERL